MKKILLLFFISIGISLQAECKKENYKHHDCKVVRCIYTQEKIYKGFAENPGRYKEERLKRCFYCGCKIEEHSKEKEENK